MAKKKTNGKKPAAKKPAKPVKKAAPPKKAAAKKVAKKPEAKAKAAAPKAKPSNAAAKKPAAKEAVKAKAVAPHPAKGKAQEKPKKAGADKHGKDIAPVEPEVDAVAAENEAEEVVLTDAEGRRYCRVKDCDQAATVDGYCRYHYLLYWKKIQIRKKILTEGKLERYIEELTARYPDKFLDMLRKDLRSEKEFLAAIQELEIDESASESEFEDEAQNYLDEVRGMGTETGAREEEDF